MTTRRISIVVERGSAHRIWCGGGHVDSLQEGLATCTVTPPRPCTIRAMSGRVVRHGRLCRAERIAAPGNARSPPSRRASVTRGSRQ